MGRQREADFEQEEYDHLIKILLLGDSSVGKTSLLQRFCENKFDSSFILTIGVDFKKKIVDYCGKRLKLQVWDTAGQERFRTITPAYFRSAMGVVLVYDITNADTFANIRYWMKNVVDFGDRSVMLILVGNKCDLASMREVLSEDAQELCDEFDVPWLEASAKSGYNVEETFMSIASLIVENRLASRTTSPNQLSDVPNVVESTRAAGASCNESDRSEEDKSVHNVALHHDTEETRRPLRRCCGL